MQAFDAYLQAGQECGLKVNFARNKTEVLLGKCVDQAEMERRISNYHETNDIPRENIKIHPDNGGDPLLYGYVYLGIPVGSEQFRRHQLRTLIDDFIQLCECDDFNCGTSYTTVPTSNLF